MAAQVGIIRSHIEEAVPGEVEQDDLLLLLLFGLECLVDSGPDGVRGFRGRDGPFGLGKGHRRLEDRGLRIGNGFNHAQVVGT